jgi:hypothetical protein
VELNVSFLIGVQALILVGLERVANLELLSQLEFGRGFMYDRPLRLNLLDLDYELAEQLVSFLFLKGFINFINFISRLCSHLWPGEQGRGVWADGLIH